MIGSVGRVNDVIDTHLYDHDSTNVFSCTSVFNGDGIVRVVEAPKLACNHEAKEADNWLSNEMREIVVTMVDRSNEVDNLVITYSTLLNTNNTTKTLWIRFLHDSGSNTHLTNDKSVFEPNSLRECNMRICGISGDDKIHPLNVKLCGESVLLRVRVFF